MHSPHWENVPPYVSLSFPKRGKWGNISLGVSYLRSAGNVWNIIPSLQYYIWVKNTTLYNDSNNKISRNVRFYLEFLYFFYPWPSLDILLCSLMCCISDANTRYLTCMLCVSDSRHMTRSSIAMLEYRRWRRSIFLFVIQFLYIIFGWCKSDKKFIIYNGITNCITNS